jgi:hypothetical protein
MRSALLVLWVVAGWCGTGNHWYVRLVRSTPQIPQPPDPWPIILIGVFAGILGGWGFGQVFGPSPETWTGVTAAATAVGAYLGSQLATDLSRMAIGARSTNRV